MSDQAIVALVLGVGGSFMVIFWFLLRLQSNVLRENLNEVVSEIKDIKTTIEEKLDVIEEKLADFDKALALKSIVIDYINKELDCIKAAIKRD